MSDYDYTFKAEDTFYDISDMLEGKKALSPQEIYKTVEERLKSAFPSYLKRCMYFNFFKDNFASLKEIGTDEFKAKFISLFKESGTPPAFTETTTKLSALAESCLTKKFVKRNTVLLIGFAFGLCVKEVNELLTKGIKEHQLNPKDPFEVICVYCYERGLGFSDFQRLFDKYQQLTPEKIKNKPKYSEKTGIMQSYMRFSGEDSLMQYLASLKTPKNIFKTSRTALDTFKALCDKTIDNLQKYHKSRDIGAQSIERYLYSYTDDNGNAQANRSFGFEEIFGGMRLTKQRISKILNQKSRVNRYDIINLCFLDFALTVQATPVQKLNRFIDYTNKYLNECRVGELNFANPYDTMILYCILCEYPLDTFQELWEYSEK